MDSWYYGQITFTPLNFFRTNIIHDISLFYGANAWHFYLTQAIPFDSMALLPFILHGFYMTAAGAAPVKTARWLSVWTMSVLSLVSHKEFRFIQPLLPILHAFAAYSLVQLANLSRSKTRRSSLLPSIRADHFHLILFINIPAILVFIVIHMRGQAGVVRYLSSIPKTELASLGFLMPCHSTPWQSHLHRYDLEVEGIPSGYGGRLWALTCEPPLG